MTQKLRQPKKIQRYGHITLLLAYAIFIYFFFINGSSLFDYWNVSWSASMIMYMVGVSLFLVIYEKIPSEFKKPAKNSIVGFGAVFILMTCLLIIAHDLGFPMFQNIVALPVHMILPTIIFSIGVVSISEEIIFRGVILHAIRLAVFKRDIQRDSLQWQRFAQKNYGKLLLIILVQAIIFGFFHYAAYGGLLESITLAIIMGTFFGFLAIFWNIGAAIGAHGAWNCYVLGATFI